MDSSRDDTIIGRAGDYRSEVMKLLFEGRGEAFLLRNLLISQSRNLEQYRAIKQ